MSKFQIQLTGLQLSVLRALWRRGESSVAEIHEELAEERRLAPTTVATLLSRLEKRGVVGHRSEGRQFVYEALISEEEANRSMVLELTERLFTGDVSALLNHLLRAKEMAPGDLARIKALIEAKEKELEGQDELV